MKILSLLIFLLSFASLSMAEMGYQRDPWGSNTWVGPGRPPHWSAPESDEARFRDFNKKRYRSRDTAGPYYDPFHKNKKSRRIIIYRQETEEPVVINKTVIETGRIPALRRPSPIRCGGDTVYLRDETTGELTIQYISPAQKC